MEPQRRTALVIDGIDIGAIRAQQRHHVLMRITAAGSKMEGGVPTSSHATPDVRAAVEQ